MHAPFHGVDSTYYKFSNTEVGSTKQELVNIFKHIIYLFYIHVLVTSHCQSHLIIQFNAAQPSEQ